MKRLFIVLGALTCFISNASGPINILISQVVDHPALNETTRGIIDALKDAGYSANTGTEIRVESAQGNMALASQIASKFMGQNPTLLVGVGTISAQSLASAAKKRGIPVVFSSITDPLGAGLIKALDNPGTGMSGVSNFVDIEPQLRLFQKLQPNLKKLGILYNPGEINSLKIVRELEKICPKLGIQLVKQGLTKTSEAGQQATKVAAQVDALFISNDNTALSCLQSILGAARKRKIPVYVSDTDAVALGATAALGPNQYQIGRQTGAMIVRVLKGADINKMPVEFPSQTDLVINRKDAP